MWEIRGKGNVVKAVPSTRPEYNGRWMEECYVTVSVESPCPIDFEIGDYIIYRNERFEINYDPGKIKSAPQNEKGDAFRYENIKFNSLADELTRCDFLDVVLNDNQLHFTGLPKFPFYGSVQDLANRMQANLDRTYGKNTWLVVVSPEYTDRKEINVSVDNIKVQGALSILVNDFKAYYTISDRTVTIGAAGIPAGHLFKYGKGNGLYEIRQDTEADQAIVTRLRAYGSTRNLPHRYYNSLTGADGKKLIPDNMAVLHLMLPAFPYSTQDPYIDSANKDALGIREGTIFFDGSQEGLEEIYPSIEGMTAEQLHDAGVQCKATGALDEIVSAEQMTDNGVGKIEGDKSEAEPSTFKVTLKDLGFDINEHIIKGNSESPTISFKTGKLGGRDFEIVDCKKEGNNYVLELNRVYDDGIKLWFPYKDYNAAPGDKFVLHHIAMPEVYIKAASQRLLKAATEWLSKNDYSRSVYAPKIDEIFMARQHDEAMASGGTIKSLHDTIKEGMLLLFEDEDLNIDASIFIDQLTIKEGDGPIPTYDVVLKEEKTVGRLDKMQNQIDSLVSGYGQGGTGGYSAAQIRSMIDAYGGAQFLSKIKNDRTPYKISSDKAFEVGEYISGAKGGILGIDSNGDSFAEIARLYVRVRAVFEELMTIKAGTLAGKQYITPGGSITCVSVAEKGLVLRSPYLATETGSPILLEDGTPILGEGDPVSVDNGVPEGVFRCFFLSVQDGRQIKSAFAPGDLAISEMFNAKAGTTNKIQNHRYWRLVTNVVEDAYTDANGNHYGFIDLSKSDCEDGSGDPSAGDVICQFGNKTDSQRASALVFTTVDADAPSIKFFVNINSYSIAGKELISLGKDPLTGSAYFRCYGSAYIGSPTGKTFFKFDEATDDLDIKAKVTMLPTSTIDGENIEDYVAGKLDVGGTNLVKNSATPFGIGQNDPQHTLQLTTPMRAGQPYCVTVWSADSVTIATVSFTSPQSETVTRLPRLRSGVHRGIVVPDADISQVIFSGRTSPHPVTPAVAKVKIERGLVGTDWSPAPADLSNEKFDYLTAALKESSHTEGGLTVATLMLLGYTLPDGEYVVRSGVNGAYSADHLGGGIAFWAGGPMIDAEEATQGQTPAKYIMRMDGSGYLAGNTVRFGDGFIRLGDNLLLSGNTLYMETSDGVGFTVKNQPIGFDLKNPTSIKPEYDTPLSDSFKADIIYRSPSSQASYTSTILPLQHKPLGFVGVGGHISVQLQATNDRELGTASGTVVPTEYGKFRVTLMRGDEEIHTFKDGSWTRATSPIDPVKNIIRYFIQYSDTCTLSEQGDYSLKIEGYDGYAGSEADVPFTATTDVMQSGQIRVSNSDSYQTIVGSDGFASSWGNSLLCATKDGSLMRYGNTYIRIGADGIKINRGDGETPL